MKQTALASLFALTLLSLSSHGGDTAKPRDDFYLRRDPKLGASVLVKDRKTTLLELLDTLRASTGLTFEVHPTLSSYDPDLSGLAPRTTKAWSILEVLAATNLEEGYWRRTPTGYELNGKGIRLPKTLKRIIPLQLREDPVLNKHVAEERANVEFAELIASLEMLTGLKLTVVPGLRDHQPKYRRVPKGPVWICMEMIARQYLVDGRWEKTVNGYQLTAKETVAAKVMAEEKAQESLAITAAEESAKLRELAKSHPLRLDTKLKCEMNVREGRLKFTDMLDRLRAATGLNLAIADNLARHDPDFGVLKIDGVKAWALMEIMAEKDLKEGRWIKTVDGYRLTGTSLASSASDKLAPPAAAWWRVLLIGGLVFMGGGAIYLTYRWRNRHAPPNVLTRPNGQN